MTDQKLVDELEKALNDEVYDGGMGALSEDQLSELVRTLASTAAKVAEEARTPANNEKLIEEAAKAIHDVAMREYPGMPADIYGWDVQKDRDRDVYLLEARAALAVFEKALTTTPPDGWFYMGSHVGAPWLNLEFSEEMDETGLPLWERPVQQTPTDDERAQAGLDSERLRQIAEWLGMEHGHDETAKRVALIADRHDRLAAGFRRTEVPESSAECTQCHRPDGLHKLGCGERFGSEPQRPMIQKRTKAVPAGEWVSVPVKQEGAEG